MDWVVLGALLAIIAGLWYLIREVLKISQVFSEPEVEPEPLDLSPLVEAISGSLKEEVLSVIENMAPPTALDHITALASTWMMTKMGQSMPNVHMPSSLPGTHAPQERTPQDEKKEQASDD